MSDVALISSLQIVSLLGSFLTTFRLFQTGLYRRYHWFFLYFLFRIPNTTWPLLLRLNSKIYFFFWVATEPITWIFHACVLLELYRLVLDKYRGLYTLGRWSMFVGMAASVAISVFGSILRLGASVRTGSKTMSWFLALERGWMLALAFFLLFMVGFLVLYTIPISANVKIHAGVYTVFFISNYLIFLLQTLVGIHAFGWTNIAANAISAACVFAWFFLLSPKGEEVPSSAPVIGPEHERRILQQLDALNTTLLRATRN